MKKKLMGYFIVGMLILSVLFVPSSDLFTKGNTDCSMCVDFECWDRIEAVCSTLPGGIWIPFTWTVTTAYCYAGACEALFKVTCHGNMDDGEFKIHWTYIDCSIRDCWSCTQN